MTKGEGPEPRTCDPGPLALGAWDLGLGPREKAWDSGKRPGTQGPGLANKALDPGKRLGTLGKGPGPWTHGLELGEMAQDAGKRPGT